MGCCAQTNDKGKKKDIDPKTKTIAKKPEVKEQEVVKLDSTPEESILSAEDSVLAAVK